MNADQKFNGILAKLETSYKQKSFSAISREDIILTLKIIQVLIVPELFETHKYAISRLGENFKRFQPSLFFDLFREQFVNHFSRNEELILRLASSFPTIRDLILMDAEAIYKGDPAAKSREEVIFAYPGFFAILTHRISHELYKSDMLLQARVISEYAHAITGVDIHPGASIGHSFFIDHGTGIVIGESAVIGDNVKLFHGVTLGNKSFKFDDAGFASRQPKRHPTIKNRVTVYANATILGGDTVIGDGSIIGSGAFVKSSVPDNTLVKP